MLISGSAGQPSLDKDKRVTALRKARLAYDDAAKRGYVSALNNLAVLYENSEGAEFSQEQAAELFKKAAQQGHALAMYNLAMHYRDGTYPIKRDLAQAAEWFALSAESGLVSAMVEYGRMLAAGQGLRNNAANPRRAVEWFQRAANSGSTRAKLELAALYYNGSRQAGINTVPQDWGLALLWYGRVAETGDSIAQSSLAYMTELGLGLPNAQPQIAERYWRLAAQGGDSRAQVEFAEHFREGLVLVKQEYGEREIITLLRRAMAQGSAKAALDLAQIYRSGELGEEKNPVEAMRLAYRAIQLSTQSDPALRQSDPTADEQNPFWEIAAAHLVVEMAKNGEAVDAAGRPLLTVAEIERLERYYGAVDPLAKQVKVRRLNNVPLRCGGGWVTRQTIWVWDWGRTEAPTEAQVRNIERTTGCVDDVLRRTLIDVFEQAKKAKVSFADLIDQRIKTAANAAVDTPRRRRR